MYPATFTSFKRLLSRQQFPQYDAKTVDVIFDRSRHSRISKHFWCHVSNGSTSNASDCLCCSLLLPFCQTKVTYLQQANKLQYVHCKTNLRQTFEALVRNCAL